MRFEESFMLISWYLGGFNHGVETHDYFFDSSCTLPIHTSVPNFKKPKSPKIIKKPLSTPKSPT